MLRKNKKIIVPTQKAYDTWIQISNKVFLLPQLYYGTLHTNSSLEETTLKILYLGVVDDSKKNIPFLLDSLLKREYQNFEISLVGPRLY
jgi:hypothetical protein